MSHMVKSIALWTVSLEYIRFCMDNTIPIKVVRCYLKNKAFRVGDRTELKHQLRESKDTYRRKMEEKLGRRDVCS